MVKILRSLVFVNYSKTLQALFRALRLDYVNFEITDSTFPPTASEQGRVRLDMEVLSIGEATRETVLTLIEAAGYRPATLRELLFLALDKRDDLLCRNPTAAFGSEVDRGGKRCPYLVRSDGENCLGLAWSEELFGESWRFAVVKV